MSREVHTWYYLSEKYTMMISCKSQIVKFKISSDGRNGWIYSWNGDVSFRVLVIQ